MFRFGLAIALVLLTSSASATPPELIEVTGPQLLRRVKDSDARLTIVNVWATWCTPCKEEFPDLLAVARAYESKGVRLMFVSTDFGGDEAQAVRFLKAQGAPLPSFLKTGKDEAFIETLSPKWVGTLPATVIFDDNGKRVGFFQGKVAREALEEALNALLDGSQDKTGAL